MMDINAHFFQWSINFLIKEASGGAVTVARSEALATRNKSALKNENMSNKDLAEELHKPIIRKFEKRKVFFNKYAWVIPSKDKKYN